MPTNDPAAIAVYLAMFGEYLFNISNTSLYNITVEADSPAQFSERRDPLGRRGLQQAEDIIVEDAATQVPFTIPFPAPAPIDWRNDFDLATLYPEYLVDDPLSAQESQNLYNSIDCSLDGREELEFDGDPSLHPTTLIRISMNFLAETDRGAQACLTMTTQNAMRDLLAPFGMTPCRDRSYICRASLEIIPAPSPPPPDNWVRHYYTRTLLVMHTPSSTVLQIHSTFWRWHFGIPRHWEEMLHREKIITRRKSHSKFAVLIFPLGKQIVLTPATPDILRI